MIWTNAGECGECVERTYAFACFSEVPVDTSFNQLCILCFNKRPETPTYYLLVLSVESGWHIWIERSALICCRKMVRVCEWVCRKNKLPLSRIMLGQCHTDQTTYYLYKQDRILLVCFTSSPFCKTANIALYVHRNHNILIALIKTHRCKPIWVISESVFKLFQVSG